MQTAIRKHGFKLLLLAGLGLQTLAASTEAQAATCKTVGYFPGVVQVFGTARGTADAPDVALCDATFACPDNARQVEVFGGVVASTPDVVVAVENAALSAEGALTLASCEVDAQGKGRVSGGVCNATTQAPSASGDLKQGTCTLYVEAPANGKAAANATCFCGAD